MGHPEMRNYRPLYVYAQNPGDQGSKYTSEKEGNSALSVVLWSIFAISMFAIVITILVLVVREG